MPYAKSGGVKTGGNSRNAGVAPPRKLAEDPGFQLRVLPVIHPSVRELKKDTITTQSVIRSVAMSKRRVTYLHDRTIQFAERRTLNNGEHGAISRAFRDSRQHFPREFAATRVKSSPRL